MVYRVARWALIVLFAFTVASASGCGIVLKTVGKGVKVGVKETKKGKPKVEVKRGKKVVVCKPAVHKPHESNGKAGWIDAKATVSCKGTGTVRRVSTTIVMQKRIGKKWKALPTTRNTSTSTSLKMKKKLTVMTGDLRCAPGTYRARAKANATVSGAKLVMKKGWMTSKVATNPC